jgi:hypothetical protein
MKLAHWVNEHENQAMKSALVMLTAVAEMEGQTDLDLGFPIGQVGGL